MTTWNTYTYKKNIQTEANCNTKLVKTVEITTNISFFYRLWKI